VRRSFESPFVTLNLNPYVPSSDSRFLQIVSEGIPVDKIGLNLMPTPLPSTTRYARVRCPRAGRN